jgi:hypothetical protein
VIVCVRHCHPFQPATLDFFFTQIDYTGCRLGECGGGGAIAVGGVFSAPAPAPSPLRRANQALAAASVALILLAVSDGAERPPNGYYGG